jgi:capsular exopolysaccharide synthesis family protein
MLPRELVGYAAGYYPEAYIEEPAKGREASGAAATLSVIWRAARKRKWLILLLTLAITSAVAAEVSRYRKHYSAYVLLEIKKDSANTLLAAGVDSDPENIVNINTKMLMIQSRPLLEDVVRKLDLVNEKRFVDIADKRSWGQWVSEVLSRVGLANEPDSVEAENQVPVAIVASSGNLPPVADNGQAQRFPDLPESDPRLDRYVAIIQRGLEVFHPRDTQALRITFTHTYPAIAADVANGVAQSFIQRHFEKKTESFNNTSSWLEKSTADLKAKMLQAEQALADYTRDHKILPNENQSLSANKVIRLNDQLSRVEADILLKQSLYEEVKQGRGDNLPEAFSDPKLADLQKRLSELQVTEAQLSVQFGPDHPKFIEVQQAKSLLHQQLATRRTTLQDKLKSDYDRAVRDREIIRDALDGAQAEASQQDQASVQYNILKDEAASASTVYKDFLQKTKQANLEVAQQHNNISAIQPAQVPKHPDGPTYGVAVLLALLGSLGGGVGIAFMMEYLDKTIKDVGDVNRYVKLPTIGVIPSIPGSDGRLIGRASRQAPKISIISDGGLEAQTQMNGNRAKGLLPAGDPTGYFETNDGRFITPEGRRLAAEAYRALRTSVLLSTDGPPKTLLFTSSEPGEGKTTTVVNAAICFAQLGGSVLIIDSDLRKPYAKTKLGSNSTVGLSSFLSGSVGIDEAIRKLDLPQVSLLPCGPPCSNPAELIGSDRMKELLRTLAAHYDHVLIDSSPLLLATDSVILSTLVDGVILVVRGGQSMREAVYQSRLMLDNVGAKVTGIVLNDVDFRRASYRQFAYYPYHEDSKNRSVDGASDILLD